jgi:hypothetical protein
LQEWQNSAGTPLASMGAGGNLVLAPASGNAITSNGQPVQFDAPGLGAAFDWTNGSLKLSARNATTTPLISKGFASQTNDLQQWQSSAAAVLARVLSDGSIYTTSDVNAGGRIDAARIFGTAASAAQVPFTAKGAASQTGDLTQWLDSAAAVVVKITAAGSLLVSGGGGVYPAAGAGLNVHYDSSSNKGFIQSYDFGGAVWKALDLKGSAVALYASATKRIEVNATGVGFYGVAPVAQQAGIVDPAYSAAIPTKIEFDALVDSVRAVITRLETVGLIAVA